MNVPKTIYPDHNCSGHGIGRTVLATMLSVGALLCAVTQGQGADPRVNVLKTPDGGIQPQAVLDSKGSLHLIYFKGAPDGGDLFYVHRDADQEAFSEPVQVNSQAGSAVAVGTIRGGQLALGKDGRVHIAWNGAQKALPQGSGGAMFYARLEDTGKAFEPQRNLMQQSRVLDGGGSVAADKEGNVYVAWHALATGSQPGEENRKVWVARSTDDGKTFAREVAASTQPTGVCGCCAMKAFADSRGAVHLLYRSAGLKVNRDIYLLSSKDRGKKFQSALVQKWKILACPMSSESFAEGSKGVVVSWETEGQVSFAALDPATLKLGRPVSPPGASRERKHPALAVNTQGETILAWTEGTGWQRGGSLVWQVFDKAGKPTEQRGRVDGGVPVWGLATVVAGAKGDFTIIH